MDISKFNDYELGELIEKYYKEIEPRVKKLYRSISNSQKLDEFEDFKLIAFNTILNNLEEFDENRCDTPAFFFLPLVEAALCEEIRGSRGYRITQTIYQNQKALSVFSDAFYKENGYHPTREEVLESGVLSNAQLNHLNNINITSVPKNDEGVEIEFACDTPTVLERLIEEEKKENFYKSVNKLKGDYRKIVDLSLKGYTDKEIYTMEGYSRQNYSKKMNKIRSLIKGDLESSANCIY